MRQSRWDLQDAFSPMVNVSKLKPRSDIRLEGVAKCAGGDWAAVGCLDFGKIMQEK